MALEKTNSIYALYQINQEIKILEKELDTLQKTYNSVKGIGFENIREKYVLTEEDEDTYDPAGYDEIWEELSDFFKPMGNWYDSLSQRIVSLEKEIVEKKYKLILNATNYQRNLTQKIQEIENIISNSNNDDEKKRLSKDKTELNNISDEIDFIIRLYEGLDL